MICCSTLIWFESIFDTLMVTIRLSSFENVNRTFVITRWRYKLYAASDSRKESECVLQKNAFFLNKKINTKALPWIFHKDTFSVLIIFAYFDIPFIFDNFHFCRSRVIGLDMTENIIFTVCRMITWVVFLRMLWNFISSLRVKRGGSLSFLVGINSNFSVMEIGWTDVGSGGYILVNCAHSNTSLLCI